VAGRGQRKRPVKKPRLAGERTRLVGAAQNNRYYFPRENSPSSRRVQKKKKKNKKNYAGPRSVRASKSPTWLRRICSFPCFDFLPPCLSVCQHSCSMRKDGTDMTNARRSLTGVSRACKPLGTSGKEKKVQRPDKCDGRKSVEAGGNLHC